MHKVEFDSSFIQVSVCVFSIYGMIVIRLHPIVSLSIARWEMFFKVLYSCMVGTYGYTQSVRQHY